MEEIVTLLIPAMLAVSLVRLLLLPLKTMAKLLIHSGSGFLCLWLLNSISGFTGIFFPINAVTALTAGIFGLPGIGVMAVLAVF